MSKKKEFVTVINGVDIRWWVDANSVKELDEASIEHIQNLLNDGFSSGELHVCYGKNMSKEAYGWWNIINWEDIAMELYNAILLLLHETEGENIITPATYKMADKAAERYLDNHSLIKSE